MQPAGAGEQPRPVVPERGERKARCRAIVEHLRWARARTVRKEVQTHASGAEVDRGGVHAVAPQFIPASLAQRIVRKGACQGSRMPPATEGHRDIGLRTADMRLEGGALQQALLS